MWDKLSVKTLEVLAHPHLKTRSRWELVGCQSRECTLQSLPPRMVTSEKSLASYTYVVRVDAYAM